MTENNPYEAPNSDLGVGTPVESDFQLHEPRGVSAGRGASWLGEGFGYFKQSAGAWILVTIVGVIIMSVVSLVPFLALISPIVYYILFGGIMIGVKAQHDGGNLEIAHMFAAFSGKANKLALLGLVSSIITYTILGIALGSMFLQIAGFGNHDPSAIDFLSFLLKFMIALALLIPLMMATWFAPVLIALNDIDVFEAMKLSFFACLKNIIPFLIYGILGFILTLIASIPLGLGMLIVLPMFAASVFAAYKDIFID